MKKKTMKDDNTVTKKEMGIYNEDKPMFILGKTRSIVFLSSSF